jgi:hypothetical protein
MIVNLNTPEQGHRQPRGPARREKSNAKIARAGATIRLGVFIALAFGCLDVAALAQAGTATSATVSKPVSRSFNFSYVVKLDSPGNARRLHVRVPLPDTDQFQTISQLELKAPGKIHVRESSKYGDRYAYFTVSPSRVKVPVEIRLTFHVVRFERRTDLTSSVSVPAPLPKGVEPFLQPDSLVPIDGVIGSLSHEQTEGLIDPLEKARKIFEYVLSTMDCGQVGSGWEQGDAVWAFTEHHGNCSDFDSLFIAMARAAGIPARFETGFSFPDQQKLGSILGYHSWAEFFVNGLGWIPLDAAEARQELKRGGYFFGAIDANRVMFSMGRDVPVVPVPQAGRLNYLVYPYVEVDGKPYSDYSIDVFFRETGISSSTPPKRPIFAEGHFQSRRLLHFPS